ncbi:hypothetical protein [Pseudomonas mandelii]|uniref:Uncharacterized protein n=1 Tax=Pseudomonas mandelii TaxID=75612 RepID=A0AB36CXF2_9PSED|nr:hypothetical protein [Pseudomonas mandelii]NMZ80679.1 hypothetical protein [Pseudomonas mandelii]
MKKRIKPVPDSLAAQCSSYTESQQVADRLQAEAIAASRNDPRPNIVAETVFAELHALIDDIDDIDDIEAKQNGTR